MVYGKGDREFEFMFNNQKLEIVEQYKYLGVIFNSVKTSRGCIFKEMHPYIAEKSTKASFAATSKFASVGKLTPQLGFKIFDTFVSPIVNYSAEIWCKTSEIQCVETVQLKFIKYLLGVKNGTSTVAILGETGRLPLLYHQQVKLVKYWIRLIQLEEKALAKKAYINCLSLYCAGYHTWVTTVVELFQYYKMGDCTNVVSLSTKEADLLLKEF